MKATFSSKHLLRHLLWISALLVAQVQVVAQVQTEQTQAHRELAQDQTDFIFEYDQDIDYQVSRGEFFSQRQQRLQAMDPLGTAQIRAQGYQAEFAKRLEPKLQEAREGHLKQTEIRFKSLDKNKDGLIQRSEFDATGSAGFGWLDTNKDLQINAQDQQPKRAQNSNKQQPLRPRSALTMPTTHSVAGMIELYDQDGDHSVGQPEFLSKRAHMFQQTDSDGNGVLSNTEYAAEFAARLDQQTQRVREKQLQQALVRFKSLDTDQNGILSTVEFHHVSQRLFARWDTSGDLVVNAQDPLPQRPATNQHRSVIQTAGNEKSATKTAVRP